VEEYELTEMRVAGLPRTFILEADSIDALLVNPARRLLGLARQRAAFTATVTWFHALRDQHLLPSDPREVCTVTVLAEGIGHNLPGALATVLGNEYHRGDNWIGVSRFALPKTSADQYTPFDAKVNYLRIHSNARVWCVLDTVATGATLVTGNLRAFMPNAKKEASVGTEAGAVKVYQGERPMAAQNRTLGKFHLTGIPTAPRGVPQIEVTFDIDANGILNVTAKDTATQKDQKITITSSSGLSKEEVERMAKEADAHAAEDKAQREAIDAKNQLDSMVYNVEKMLRENGDKISGTERGDVENAVADAKKALESNDKAQMDKARETLTTASHKLAEEMYKAAQAKSAPAGGPSSGPTDGAGAASGANGSGQKKDEGVIDAEYVDVEDKK